MLVGACSRSYGGRSEPAYRQAGVSPVLKNRGRPIVRIDLACCRRSLVDDREAIETASTHDTMAGIDLVGVRNRSEHAHGSGQEAAHRLSQLKRWPTASESADSRDESPHRGDWVGATIKPIDGP